ncbi:MAG TPA: hypothetical protein VID03_00530 [Acidimicrobiia bacterium]|jgi:hypothetical protein
MAISRSLKPSKPGRDAVEVVATVLLAVGAVLTAWCSYQANRWNGEQTKATSRVNGLRVEAARADGLARTQSQLDVATFIAWVDAELSDNQGLADFYAERFRAEFKPAFQAWMDQDPFNNPSAPSSPFAMEEYQLQAQADAERLDQETTEAIATVGLNIQRSANYVLGVVLFAAAMFFAAMGTRLQSPALRKVLVGVACALFLTSLVWVASFPVSFSV